MPFQLVSEEIKLLRLPVEFALKTRPHFGVRHVDFASFVFTMDI